MKNLLKTHFGYDEFRPLQEEVIGNVLGKKDSFVLMPTGDSNRLQLGDWSLRGHYDNMNYHSEW